MGLAFTKKTSAKITRSIGDKTWIEIEEQGEITLRSTKHRRGPRRDIDKQHLRDARVCIARSEKNLDPIEQ